MKITKKSVKKSVLKSENGKSMVVYKYLTNDYYGTPRIEADYYIIDKYITTVNIKGYGDLNNILVELDNTYKETYKSITKNNIMLKKYSN